MEVALFIIAVMIPVTLINQMMMRKALFYLKPEHKKKEFIIAFNFLWPKKEYFYPEGWKYWIRLRWLGFTEMSIFLILMYFIVI